MALIIHRNKLHHSDEGQRDPCKAALTVLQGAAAKEKEKEEERRMEHSVSETVTLATDEPSMDAWERSGMHALQLIHFRSANAFQEELDFTTWQIDYYQATRVHILGADMKESLGLLKETTDIQGIFMGVRHGDPHSAHLEHFSATSAGWPAFLRINPIINWKYSQIWQLLLGLGWRYCELYDQGFTSLGEKHNTLPNPHLWRVDGTYAPASLLQDGSFERCGRQVSRHLDNNTNTNTNTNTATGEKAKERNEEEEERASSININLNLLQPISVSVRGSRAGMPGEIKITPSPDLERCVYHGLVNAFGHV